MALYQRDSYSEQHKQGPGFGFVLTWIAANLAAVLTSSPLIDLVSNMQISGPLAYIVPQSIGGFIVGLLLGIAQAVVLFPYLKRSGSILWIGATIAGRIFRALILTSGFTLLAAIFPLAVSSDTPLFCVPFSFVFLFGAFAGAVTSYLQARLLKRYVAHSAWWLGVNSLLAASVSLFVGIFGGSTFYFPAAPSRSFDNLIVHTEATFSPTSIISYAMSLLITVAVTAAFTGYVLLDLIRHPTSKATWSLPTRKERTPAPTITETQPSPEAILAQQKQQKST